MDGLLTVSARLIHTETNLADAGEPMRGHEAGFTLIELMIVVVVIAILASIVYPSYTRYVEEARRADAKAGLFTAAQQLERCYTQRSSYQDCGISFPKSSPDEHYSIRVDDEVGGSLTDSSYKLVAVPQGAQSDDKCGNLTLTQTGEPDSTGDGDDCW